MHASISLEGVICFNLKCAIDFEKVINTANKKKKKRQEAPVPVGGFQCRHRRVPLCPGARPGKGAAQGPAAPRSVWVAERTGRPAQDAAPRARVPLQQEPANSPEEAKVKRCPWPSGPPGPGFRSWTQLLVGPRADPVRTRGASCPPAKPAREAESAVTADGGAERGPRPPEPAAPPS